MHACGLFSVVLTGVVLGPSIWAGGFVGDAGVDVWSHVWGMSWFAESVFRGQVPWHVDGLRYPEGGVLWYIDLLGAVLALPAMGLGAYTLGYNGVLAAQGLLAAAGGWAWDRSLGGRGLVGATALATTPFLLCTWSNGVVEAGWLGLVAVTAAMAARGSRWTGAALGLCFVATPYLGISAAVLAGVVLIDRRRWRLLAATWGIGLLVAVPMAVGLAVGFEDPASMAIKPPPGPRWPTWRINGVDPRAFVLPGDFWSVRIRGDGAPPFRRTPYLGWTLIVLATLGWVRGRAPRMLLAAVGLGCVLALGPILFWQGDFVRWPGSGDPVWLPFGWIWAVTGVGMDHPLRFVSMAIVALAGVAGASLGRRTLHAGAVAGLITIEALVLAPNVWPLPTSSSEVPTVYETMPDDGLGVVDLPADKGGTMETSRYLYWHAVHGRPMPYGNKVSGDLLRVDNDALRRWMTRRRPGSAHRRDLEQLTGWGYGWVVLHEELCAPTCRVLVDRVSTDLGPPRTSDGAWVWALAARDSNSHRRGETD